MRFDAQKESLLISIANIEISVKQQQICLQELRGMWELKAPVWNKFNKPF